jgi:hypothetical protein
MKKLVAIIAMFTLFSLVLSGCTTDDSNNSNSEEKNDDSNSWDIGNANIMTVIELLDDLDAYYEINPDGISEKYIDYKSLKEGDVLIIKDEIVKIEYSSVKDITEIYFKRYTGEYSEFDKSNCFVFDFTGDITNSFEVGDMVMIKLTIKHVTFSSDTTEYDMELFKEQWVDSNYYLNNREAPLSSSFIKKA